MDVMLESFKVTMRYQLSTFQTPEGTPPVDPKETPNKARSKTIDRLQNKIKKPKKKQKVEVRTRKNEEEKRTLLGDTEDLSNVKKTKRRAPAPPSSLGDFNAGLDPSNPFFEDED